MRKKYAFRIFVHKFVNALNTNNCCDRSTFSLQGREYLPTKRRLEYYSETMTARRTCKYDTYFIYYIYVKKRDRNV